MACAGSAGETQRQDERTCLPAYGVRYRREVTEQAAADSQGRAAGELLVGELSESQLISRILPLLRESTEVLVGPGDDAAVIPAPDGRLVVSMDTLVQDADFRLVWPNGYSSSGYDVGWKAAAQNLSDINAMGAHATGMVVSLSMPGHTPVNWMQDFATGLQQAIDQLGADRCTVVGGDLSQGRELAITITVFGDLGGAAPLLRSTAAEGQLLMLAGAPGRAAAGWAILESRHSIGGLDADQRQVVNTFCRPQPPLGAGPAALRAGAGAAMDISDGLLRDAERLAEASGVAIDLDAEALRGDLPALASAARLLAVDPMTWVLGGGEDYGLLACFSPGTALPDGFRVIGSVGSMEQSSARVTISGRPHNTVGWDHFAH